MFNNDPYYNVFVVALLGWPLVVGALSSSWQRAVLWMVAVLGFGMAFQGLRDWWFGQPHLLHNLDFSQILVLLASIIIIYGTLALIGYGLKLLVWRRTSKT